MIDVTSKPGADYEFIIAQLQDLGTRCENPDGSNREFLEGQKDRYERYYREIEALEDGFRELSLTTDDREAADGYAANARKYEEALEGLPKPWSFLAPMKLRQLITQWKAETLLLLQNRVCEFQTCAFCALHLKLVRKTFPRPGLAFSAKAHWGLHLKPLQLKRRMPTIF